MGLIFWAEHSVLQGVRNGPGGKKNELNKIVLFFGGRAEEQSVLQGVRDGPGGKKLIE